MTISEEIFQRIDYKRQKCVQSEDTNHCAVIRLPSPSRSAPLDQCPQPGRSYQELGGGLSIGALRGCGPIAAVVLTIRVLPSSNKNNGVVKDAG